MKKILLLSLIAIALALTAGLIVVCSGYRSDLDFYRVAVTQIQPDHKRFRTEQRTGKLFFNRKDKESFLEFIPSINGTYFYLNGTREVEIKPAMFGDIGLYIYVEFHSLIKRWPIGFVLEKTDGQTEDKLFEAAFGRMSRPLFNRVHMEKGDKFKLKFRGTGIVYFSQPLVYRRKPPRLRRNIFLIGVDTFRGDHVGMKVNGRSLTPHIDRFKRDSVCFNHAYSQSPWTIPSFTSLFTGLYEFNHNVDIRHGLDPDKPHLVENMSRDYITFGLHGGCGLDGRWGYFRGFDFYQYLVSAGVLFPEGGKALFDRALKFLTESEFPRLFFFLHTYQTHFPYTPPREFLLEINKNPRYLTSDAINDGARPERFEPVDDGVRRSLTELYQAEVLAFDRFFGDFIEKLKKENLYENAMIVLMSDHGEEFFDHQGWYHCHTLYDELIKVPLIIKFPGDDFQNIQISEPVGVIDIMPTILGYWGVDFQPEQIDGVSLMPMIRGNTDSERGFLFSSVSTSRYLPALPPRLGAVSGSLKLIHNFPYTGETVAYFKNKTFPPDRPPFELYDLGKDPGELTNIFRDGRGMIKPVIGKLMDLKKKVQRIIKIRSLDKREIDGDARKKLETLGYL